MLHPYKQHFQTSKKNSMKLPKGNRVRCKLPAGTMKADDLFDRRRTQLFCRKTGAYVGTIINGVKPAIQDLPEQLPEPLAAKNDSQLSLF